MKPATLLRFYPRSWRDRYGGEFVALLEREGTGPRVVMNVLAGAFDAWVSPRRVDAMAANDVSALKLLQSKPDTTGKYERDWWIYLGGALVAGLVVHGIGQMIHPGRQYPISFLAGFMSAWQLWFLRTYGLRTRLAAAFWVFLIMTAGVWLLHFSLHRFVYPMFGYEA